MSKSLRHSWFYVMRTGFQKFRKLLGLYLSNFHSKNGSGLVIMSIMFPQDKFWTKFFQQINNNLNIETMTIFDQF